MTARLLAFLARLLTGARARWQGCMPDTRLRIYFANHTSNLDFLLLWSALPTELRRITRPVGAQDYWRASKLREWLAAHVFRAVLIERKSVNRSNNPLAPMLAALGDGQSLIIFPEGTRLPDCEVGAFKPGLFHIARKVPGAELIPVFIENLSRVLPKGEFLPVPLLCSVRFGSPMQLAGQESKTEFLERARRELIALRPE